jgi:predicted unusual protein kinase regulating ubiquinone biosynthesis (AarF/ABC1/UbiB family)
LLNDVYAEQILRLGILHADPHPGNLRVQPGPRLVLLDHGLTVPLKPELVASLKKMVQSLTVGDFDGLAHALADAGLKLEGDVDFTALLNLVGVLLGNSQSGGDAGDADDAESDTENETVGVGMQIGRSIGAIPIDLLLVGRALGLLDGITKQLDPGMDTMEIVAHYT